MAMGAESCNIKRTLAKMEFTATLCTFLTTYTKLTPVKDFVGRPMIVTYDMHGHSKLHYSRDLVQRPYKIVSWAKAAHRNAGLYRDILTCDSG